MEDARIPHAFGERAVMKLMFVALIRTGQIRRGIPINDFKRRQLDALREELNVKLNRRHATAPASAWCTTRVRLQRCEPANRRCLLGAYGRAIPSRRSGAAAAQVPCIPGGGRSWLGS